MLHSLRSKIIAMTVIVALMAILCVALFARRSALAEFQQYISYHEAADLERFRGELTENYQQHRGWSDAQSLLETLGRQTDKQLILADSQSRVLAAAPRDLLQDRIQITPQHDFTIDHQVRRGAEITASQIALRNVPHVSINDPNGTPVGTLYVGRLLPRAGTQREEAFAQSLNWRLLISASLAVAIAIVAALFLSQRIVRPLGDLTRVVRAIKDGDLEQRVNLQSRDELGELGRAFDAMADSLVRLEQLRRNMVTDIAHELRTPLTNIRCQIESCQDGLVSPTAETINSLYEETLLLQRLIDDLQDLALAEAGEMRLSTTPTSVREEIENAVAAMEGQLNEHGLSVEIKVAETCPQAMADRKRLGQVIRNLIANAIAHTPVQGQIKISAIAADSFVQVTVEDTGCGIAAKDLPFVFERFYRADSSRNRASGGSGLGLAIVKQIVTAHGGEIKIESSPGMGSQVSFTIPQSSAAANSPS